MDTASICPLKGVKLPPEAPPILVTIVEDGLFIVVQEVVSSNVPSMYIFILEPSQVAPIWYQSVLFKLVVLIALLADKLEFLILK